MKSIIMGAILFTIILFFIYFLNYQFYLSAHYSRQKAIENRVLTMQRMIENIFDDSSRAMKIIANRALVSAVNYVVSNGIPLNSANESIKELILQSSIEGKKQSLMEGSNINDWIETIKYLISLHGFDANIVLENLEIRPYDSFSLEILYKLKIFLTDKKIDANMTKEREMRVLISIENIEDPSYPLNTYGRVANVIRKSPNWPNYFYDNTTNLLNDLLNSYYNPSLYGASFLDRLEGKYFVQEKYKRENIIGLESFVNKEKIATSGIPVNYNQTNIDYLYFSNSPVRSFLVYGMPNSFRLDNESTINNKTHLQIYNVSVIP